MAAARTCYGIRTFTSSAKDGLFGGAVHIRIVPRPRNLGESREILRILEKFGEIVLFKHLKYEPLAPAPNTILAIYKNPSSAQTLMKASPLLLKLELKITGWKYLSSETPGLASESATPDLPTASREEANNQAEPSSIEPQSFRSSGYRENTQKNIAAKDSNFQSLGGSQKWGTRGPSVSTKSSAPEIIGSEMPIPALGSIPSPERHPTLDAAAPSPHPSRPTTSQYREFELKVAPSNMNHQAYIERQGYYGPFIINRKTVMAQDLDRRVPLEGLLDCQVGKPEVPLRIRIKRTEQGTLVPFSLRAFTSEALVVQLLLRNRCTASLSLVAFSRPKAPKVEELPHQMRWRINTQLVTESPPHRWRCSMKAHEMKFARYSLCQLLCALLAKPAPASLVPALSFNVTGHTLCSNNVPEIDGGSLPFLNLNLKTLSTNPGEIFVYPVTGTTTKLYITFPPKPQPILKAKLGNTILQTQRALRAYVAEHHAVSVPLRNQDDPYESNSDWKGCAFCVTHYPATHPHLTSISPAVSVFDPPFRTPASHPRTMSLATQAMEIFEGPCSRTADGGCDACVSCRRRGLLHARLLEHFSFDAARQLRSGRRYLPSGNCNCATLPGMFIDLFQHIRPQAIQAKALARWDDWAQKRGPSFTMERMRDLKAVTGILDDYFFQGTLGPYIKLRRVAFNTKALGKTTPFAFDRQVNAPRLSNNAPRLSNSDPRVTIRITPPPGQKLIYRWTREIRKIRNKQGRRPYARPRRKFVGRRVMDIARGLQSWHAATIGVLSTVLHELGHAAFQIFGCQACCMRGSVGDCGHGEAWRRLCEAMEQQANRSLTGIGTWRVVD